MLRQATVLPTALFWTSLCHVGSAHLSQEHHPAPAPCCPWDRGQQHHEPHTWQRLGACRTLTARGSPVMPSNWWRCPVTGSNDQ